jgi:hypothetical protein
VNKLEYTIKGFDLGKYDCDTMILDDDKGTEFQVPIAKGLINESLIDTTIEIENIFNGVLEEL